MLSLSSNKNDQSVTFMENKPYERTQRSFNYTPASIFTNQWSNLAFGVGMIVIPAIFPFGLRIRHLRILSPAVFSTILIAGGVLLDTAGAKMMLLVATILTGVGAATVVLLVGRIRQKTDKTQQTAA